LGSKTTAKQAEKKVNEYYDTGFSNSGWASLQIRFGYFFLFLVKRKKITNPFICGGTIERWVYFTDRCFFTT